MDELDLLDEIDDEGTEDELEANSELMLMIPDDEDTQEEGFDEEDSVIDEITRQVAMLGSSISEISQLKDSLLVKVFRYLDLDDLVAAAAVCVVWRKVILWKDEFWRPIYEAIQFPVTSFLPIPTYYERFMLHCKRRSQERGRIGLVDIC